jgi:hypothetical protein
MHIIRFHFLGLRVLMFIFLFEKPQIWCEKLFSLKLCACMAGQTLGYIENCRTALLPYSRLYFVLRVSV